MHVACGPASTVLELNAVPTPRNSYRTCFSASRAQKCIFQGLENAFRVVSALRVPLAAGHGQPIYSSVSFCGAL